MANRSPKLRDEKGRFIISKIINQEEIECACGCGQKRLKYDERKRENRCLVGHGGGNIKRRLKILDNKCKLCNNEIIGKCENKIYCDDCQKIVAIKKIYKQYEKNVVYRLKNYLRTRLRTVLNNYANTGKIMSSKKYGVDYDIIIEHLKPFPEDLSKYHIDHIKPLCSFNFINPDGSTNLDEVRKAFAPENHQWLTAEENEKKRMIDGTLPIMVRNKYIKKSN